MEKKIAGLLGAVAALGALNTAQASPAPAPAPSDVLRANSYADLLEPIPNAAKVLQALDEQTPAKSPAESADGNVQVAQLYYHHHHHHHHHHHYDYWGRGPILVVPPRRYYYYHHHHHHHHHHHYYGYYRY